MPSTGTGAAVSTPGRIIAIYGPPGAGKTTVAKALVDMLGATYVGSGDVARQVDQESVARGDMADRTLLARGFAEALGQAGSGRVIVDGLPRYPQDVDLLPAEETIYILLNVDPTVGNERQMKRGREGDTPELAALRTRRQRQLMELDDAGGWAYALSPWQRRLDTSRHRPDYVVRMVYEYLIGRKSTIG